MRIVLTIAAAAVSVLLTACRAEPEYYDYSGMLALYKDIPGLRLPTPQEAAVMGPFWPTIPERGNAAYYLALAGREIKRNQQGDCPPPPGSCLATTLRAYEIDEERCLPLELPGFVNDAKADIWLVTLLDIRSVSHLLADAGFVAELRGDPELAGDRYMEQARLGVKLQRRGVSIQQTVGVGIISQAQENLSRLITNTDLGSATLKEIIALCGECELSPAHAEEIPGWEVEWMAAEDALFHRHQGEAMRRLRSTIDELNRMKLEHYLAIEKTIAEALNREYRFVNAHNLAGSMAYQRAEQLWVNLNVRVTRVRAAISLYWTAHSTLPETLDDLVPDCLSAIPLDPFDDQPLRYTRTEDAWTIVSAGEAVGKDPHMFRRDCFRFSPSLPTNRESRTWRKTP